MRLKARFRWRKAQALLASAAVATGVAALWPPEAVLSPLMKPLARLERVGYDALFALRGPEPARIDPRIAVVGFTRESERTLGTPWPPPRALHAKVIENLTADGAKLIVYDALFSTPSTPEDDKALHRAIAASGRVILAFRFDRDLLGKQISPEFPFYDDEQGIDLEGAAAGLGFVDVQVDEDGVVRSLVPLLPFQDEWHPSLAACAFLAAEGRTKTDSDSDEIGVRIGTSRLESPIASAKDPIYGLAVHQFLVDFSAGATAFPMPYSFEQVAARSFPSGYFRDRIVFVGVTGLDLAKHLNDVFVTSYTRLAPSSASALAYSGIPGALLQAHFLNALLTDGFLRPWERWKVWASSFLLTFLGIGVVRRWMGWRGPAIGATLLVAYCALVYGLFSWGRIAVPWVTPTAGLLLAAGMTAWIERGALRRKWSGYVAPAVLERILRDDEGGTSQRFSGSVLFADIRGFTSLSERHSPETVVRMLNAHFERLVDAVFAERGTVDRFLGDGLLAVFGAPVAIENNALSAVRSALRMRDAALQPLRLDGEEHALHTGIGIATGPFVAGHVGARKRHDYTVIGDTVNIAARLQGLTGGADVVIDEATYDTIREHLETEPLGEIAVKGRELPVECHRVLGLKAKS